jgi:DNA mismatch repair protein MutS
LFWVGRLASPAAQPAPLDTLVAVLQALDPDEMSPREAMDALYALKAKLSMLP